ncbi:hypothetical protein [Rummeliibacillus sp. TYF005]|uniref:hypothetical protein n=1 Tax=Rummeliibacillus sp. TYF005 TaxID=2058214 RepID=UPI0013DDE4F3|nr:hypothetical protein [Rummeliibacillus sp. TYF005]
MANIIVESVYDENSNKWYPNLDGTVYYSLPFNDKESCENLCNMMRTILFN